MSPQEVVTFNYPPPPTPRPSCTIAVQPEIIHIQEDAAAVVYFFAIFPKDRNSCRLFEWSIVILSASN